MKHKIEAVKRFHEAFKIGYRTTPKADLGDSKNKLRFDLMREENEEYFQAAQANDLVEVADALGDMLYILCGTLRFWSKSYSCTRWMNSVLWVGF